MSGANNGFDRSLAHLFETCDRRTDEDFNRLWHLLALGSVVFLLWWHGSYDLNLDLGL